MGTFTLDKMKEEEKQCSVQDSCYLPLWTLFQARDSLGK